MTKKEEDFIRRILAIVAENQGGLEEQVAVQIENQIRNEYGGDRPYIACAGWNNREERERCIEQEIRAGIPDHEVARRYCVHRVTVWRMRTRLLG